MYISILLFGFSIIAGFIFRKSKVCTGIIYIVMVALAAFRTKSADLSNYYMEYKNLYKWDLSSYRYIGFTKIEYFFSGIINISFESYLILFYLFCFSILIICIKSMTKNVNFVLSCYLIYSYAIDAIQMKSLIGNVFALSGICLMFIYLREKEITDKRRIVILILSPTFIFFAAIMHFSTLYFAIPWFFLLIYCKRKDISGKVFRYVVIAFIAIYSGLITVFLNFASQLGLVSDLDYLSSWTSKNTHIGWLLYAFVIILMFFISRLLPCKQDNNFYLRSYVETSVFIIPLLMMDVTYFRNIRISFIIFYSYIANRKFSKKMSLKEFLAYVLFVILMIYVFILDLYATYDGTLGALFKYNSLLSF